MAIEKNWESVMILEDDIVFSGTNELIESKIRQVSKLNWDVILLGVGIHRLMVCDHDFLLRVHSSTCTHGYIVRKHYYNTLLENYNKSLEKMQEQLNQHLSIKGNEHKKLSACWAIDQSWISLQNKDIFYVFYPLLAKQNHKLISDCNDSIDGVNRRIENFNRSREPRVKCKNNICGYFIHSNSEVSITNCCRSCEKTGGKEHGPLCQKDIYKP
jgi:GR25 family glycosyltransferase involved in LPS biosynthesis